MSQNIENIPNEGSWNTENACENSNWGLSSPKNNKLVLYNSTDPASLPTFATSMLLMFFIQLSRHCLYCRNMADVNFHGTCWLRAHICWSMRRKMNWIIPYNGWVFLEEHFNGSAHWVNSVLVLSLKLLAACKQTQETDQIMQMKVTAYKYSFLWSSLFDEF